MDKRVFFPIFIVLVFWTIVFSIVMEPPNAHSLIFFFYRAIDTNFDYWLVGTCKTTS